MLDAGVSLRDVQIAARHADPRHTMRYDRARNVRIQLEIAGLYHERCFWPDSPDLSPAGWAL